MANAKTIAGRTLADFPADIKKGDTITIPGGPSYRVAKTPAETGSHSCLVKDAKGKEYWQFAFVGILVNGKPIE